MTNTLISIVGALAAVFSAIAAFFAWKVAHNTLRFQKRLLKNKVEIEIISDLIENLIILKTIRQLDPLEVPDEQFCSIDKLLSDIECLMKDLSSRNDIFKNKIKNDNIVSKTEKLSLYDLIASSNPWEDLQEGDKDIIDEEIVALRSIRNELL